MAANLPEIAMTPKLKALFDEGLLNFLSALYVAGYRSRPHSTSINIWFLQEIAYYLAIVYPNRPTHELEQILTSIAQMAKQSKETRFLPKKSHFLRLPPKTRFATLDPKP